MCGGPRAPADGWPRQNRPPPPVLGQQGYGAASGAPSCTRVMSGMTSRS